jgi:ubiquinone biosynthesis protein
MLAGQCMMNEAVGRSLAPEFQLADVVEPYARRLVGTLYSPAHVGRRLRQGTIDLATLGLNLPQRVNGLLRQVERGDIEVSVNVKDLNMAIVEMHRMVNRLAITVIIAAMIVSLAIVFQVYRAETFEGLIRAAVGFGFAIALIGGVWLIFSIVRSGRG